MGSLLSSLLVEQGMIVSKFDSRCFTLGNGAVYLDKCDGKRHQQWTWNKDEEIISLLDEECLDFGFGLGSDMVYMHPCHGEKNQRWVWHPSDSTIRNRHDESKCLTQMGTSLKMRPCTARLNQPFLLTMESQYLKAGGGSIGVTAPPKEDNVFNSMQTTAAETLRLVKETIQQLRATITETHETPRSGKETEEHKLFKEFHTTAMETLLGLAKEPRELLKELQATERQRFSKEAGEEQTLLREIRTMATETLQFTKHTMQEHNSLKELQAMVTETQRFAKEAGEEQNLLKDMAVETLRLAKKIRDKQNLLMELQTIATETLRLVKQGREDTQKLWQEGPKNVWIPLAVLGTNMIAIFMFMSLLHERKAAEQKLDCLKEVISTATVESHQEDDSSSSCTMCSWTDVASGQSCCFLPDTYLKMVTDTGREDVSAQRLFEGARVVAADGTEIQVLRPPEQHQVDAVIELRAGVSCLVVSPDHRILIPGARNKTMQAKELEVGSDVNLDGIVAKLTSLEWKFEPTIVLKISFVPDLPVAAFMRSPAILSKGSREKPLVRRAARKSGQGQDSKTIPDTEPPLTP